MAGCTPGGHPRAGPDTRLLWSLNRECSDRGGVLYIDVYTKAAGFNGAEDTAPRCLAAAVNVRMAIKIHFSTSASCVS